MLDRRSFRSDTASGRQEAANNPTATNDSCSNVLVEAYPPPKGGFRTEQSWPQEAVSTHSGENPRLL